jgi:hypothetical protein
MTRAQILLVVLACCLAIHVGALHADFNAGDPGPRPDPSTRPKSAGGTLSGLSPAEQALFAAGLEDFDNYFQLSQSQHQDLLNFPRSL